ncbi:MAG: type II secretion system protein [Deltaproteobacteria bacterium]|nr:type II secretion system protein [Deltaproteobacteria bacterium]
MKGEKGFSLIEVALAIALLGVVAAGFLGALATGSKSISIADERATAESLARAQMEYVRSQEYVGAPWDYTVTSSYFDEPGKEGWWDDDPPPLLSGDYDTYTVIVNTVPLNGAIDNGIQVITVAIQHTISGETKDIFTLEGYRAQRDI